eukprot:206813-Pelagomonas_calceolata.AAC.6
MQPKSKAVFIKWSHLGNGGQHTEGSGARPPGHDCKQVVEGQLRWEKLGGYVPMRAEACVDLCQ